MKEIDNVKVFNKNNKLFFDSDRDIEIIIGESEQFASPPFADAIHVPTDEELIKVSDLVKGKYRHCDFCRYCKTYVDIEQIRCLLNNNLGLLHGHCRHYAKKSS